MKERIPLGLVHIVALLFFTCFSIPASGGEILTVEETIASAYMPVVPNGVYQHANPKARPAIVEMFDKAVAGGDEPSAGALVLLGYLGTDEDVERLKEYVERQRGQVRSFSGVYSAMTGLGRMAYRRIEPAKEVLSSMAQKQYWADLAIHTMPDWLYEKYPDLITVNAVYAKYMLDVINQKPLLSQEEMLENFYPAYRSDDDGGKRFIYQIAIARKGAASLAGSQEKKSGFRLSDETQKNLERFYERHHLGKAPAQPEKATSPAPTRPIEQVEEMMKVAVSSGIAESAETKAQYAALAGDAVVAFQNFFVSNIEKGAYDSLKGRILDDGKPQKGRMVEKYWSEILQELQVTQEPLIRAMQTRNLSPDPSRYTAGQAEDGSFIVKIPIPNSRAIVDEHWPESDRNAHLLAETFAISDSLELVLIMRRIDGNWYWNPFGW